ncbi:Hsp70 family protein [Asanoa sp. NPDC050611]|uniref:Hsp70 family protein n=1 Tax=Asanoa sp. NPDC050611 TaxID=3157098 RepID=UPI0033CC53A6
MNAHGARLGIDFGTSHTVAVLADQGQPARTILFDGSPLLPSAVCLDPAGRLVVGRDALHLALSMPAGFEPTPKRRIDDGTVLLGPREVPVEGLIGAVLGRVLEEARRVAAEPVTGTTLTYPAAWGSRRRDLLRAVAERTLPSVRLVAEPVAAASFFADRALPVGQCALVYDFGGGTFDASVVRRHATGFETVATEGLADCGGLDIDAAIIAHLGATAGRRDEAAWRRLTSPTDVADRRASRQLWDNVRTGKEMLSRAGTTLVHVPLIDADVPLGREELDELAAPILARTVEATRAVLTAAGIADRELGAVYLAGGSSRMPAAGTALHRQLGIAPTQVDQPELVVAEGSLRALDAPEAVPTAPAAVVVPRRRRRVALWSGLALAVLLVAGLALAPTIGGRDGRDPGVAAPTKAPVPAPAASSPGPPTPSPSPSASSKVDPCVLGRWRLTSATLTNGIDGNDVQFHGGAGKIVTYRADGRVTNDFNTGAEYTATVRGAKWRLVYRGVVTANVLHDGGYEYISGIAAKGSYVYYRNGARQNSGALDLDTEPAKYRCDGKTLRYYYSAASEEYTRVG